MNVVVFKSNYLGDNVVFLPVVQALRRRCPAWHVSLVTHPALRALYAGDIANDDLLLVPPGELLPAWRRPWRAWPWRRWVRARRPAAVLVSCDQSTVAHVLARFSGARVRLGARFGMPLRRSGLTHAVEWRPGWSIAQWHWEMAREFVALLGGPPLPDTPPPPDLSHLTGGAARVPGRVVIHPGAKRELVRWPVARYADLAARLAARGYEVLWSRTPEADIPLPAGVQAADTADLGDLVRVLATASLFIGNASGPMHLANAVGTPLVIPSGPTPLAWDPAWHRDRVQLLRRPELPCQPCDGHHLREHGCHHAAEPLACLRRWAVADIERRCVEQLQRTW